MPFISNKHIGITVSGTRHTYHVKINYNQTHHFYCRIPEEFRSIIDNLSRDETQKLGIAELKATRSRARALQSYREEWICWAQSEADCESGIRHAIRVLLETNVHERDVIMLFYSDSGSHHSGRVYNDDNPQIDIMMGLTYAMETTVKEKKTYTTGNGRRVDGGLYDCIILDDTEENRQFLENLYNSLKQLQTELTKYTQSPEVLQRLIESKQNLIGSSHE